jgi:hypothetical protein
MRLFLHPSTRATSVIDTNPTKVLRILGEVGTQVSEHKTGTHEKTVLSDGKMGGCGTNSGISDQWEIQVTLEGDGSWRKGLNGRN